MGNVLASIGRIAASGWSSPMLAQSAPADLEVSAWWHVLLLIGVPGMVGGVAYSLGTGKLELPRRLGKASFAPGCVADLLFGLIGAFAVFLLLPTEFPVAISTWQLVKVLALAAVGGVGGRAIVDRVLLNLLKQKLQEVEQRQEDTEGELDRRERAMSLVHRQLDLGKDTTPADDDEVIKAVANAPDETKAQIFYLARRARGEAEREGDAARKQIVSRVIPIFRGLIASDKEKEYHRNYGQIGYALKGQQVPDWRGAHEMLTEAIRIRDRKKVAGYGLYEFNRAMCKIALDRNFQQQQASAPDERQEIMADLKAAANDPYVRDVIKNELQEQKKPEAYVRWIRLNLEERAATELGLG